LVIPEIPLLIHRLDDKKKKVFLQDFFILYERERERKFCLNFLTKISFDELSRQAYFILMIVA